MMTWAHRPHGVRTRAKTNYPYLEVGGDGCHASRNVRERVLPAPKTPATASVDLSERSADAHACQRPFPG